jgi:hypothetical protein
VIVPAVSRTLRSLLDAAITASADPELPHVPTTLAAPRDVRPGTTPAAALSLWLYRVNRAPHAPDAVALSYLVTPICSTPEAEQALLGTVLQTLDDNAIVAGSALAAPLDPAGDELRITLEPLTLEELTRLWAALDEPYRLSLSYVVRLVRAG